MALDGGGSPERLTARRLLNAAYTLHLDFLRSMTAWDPSAYYDLVERFDAELDAPFPRPARQLPAGASPMPTDADDTAAAAALRERIQQRIAAIRAQGGEVSVG